MSKDPAFLFYSQDWVVGTQTMSFEDRGKYITILAMMHQQGRFDEETIRLLVGSVSVKLRSKFDIDENGMWFNVKLEKEIEKRRQFTDSRRVNGSLGGRPKTEEKPSGLASGEPSEKPIGVATKNLVEDENVILIIQAFNTITTRDIIVTEDRKKQIKARLKQGYKIEDFKTVISFKYNEWKNDKEMKKYIDPETFFSTKFTKYLEAARLSKPTSEKRENEVLPKGYPNPQSYYATCWEKKIKPVRWENGDILSDLEIEQQHKIHKVGQYQYAR